MLLVRDGEYMTGDRACNDSSDALGSVLVWVGILCRINRDLGDVTIQQVRVRDGWVMLSSG